MRDYGKVYSTFWTSETTRDFSDTARILALYLLTCQHSTICGVFRLPDAYISEDLEWPIERVKEGFGELLAKGFINRCETTKWVFISKYLDWNKPENPNQWKAARKIAAQIPNNCSWLVDFIEVFNRGLHDKVEPLANPSETLSKPVVVTGTVIGTETVKTHTQARDTREYFQLDFDWKPNPVTWDARAFTAGLEDPDYQNHLTEFISHYRSHAAQPEDYWIGKLISWIKRAHSGGKSNATSKPNSRPSLAEATSGARRNDW